METRPLETLLSTELWFTSPILTATSCRTSLASGLLSRSASCPESLELLKIEITYPIRAIAECTRHMHQTIRWERNRVSEIGTRLLIKAGSLNYGKHRNCEISAVPRKSEQSTVTA